MFNLSFLNSFFLYGLILVSAPVIIHLVNKKKAVMLKFPTIRFVIESNKRVAKKFKLRQIILLILRTLAVLFIIFLFARPLIKTKEDIIDYANLKRGTVIILDNSSSMLHKGYSKSFFDDAVSSAKSIITGKKNIDNAAILTTVDNKDKPLPDLSYSKEELLDLLGGIRVSYKDTDIPLSFSKAVDILKDSSATLKEIYFISDMQDNGWKDESNWGEGLKKSIRESDINVYFVDVAAKIKIDNLGIVSVSVTKESKGKINVLNIFSMIRNFSNTAAENVLVKTYIKEDEVVKGFVNLKPGETSDKGFFAPTGESGIITGKVKLKPDSFTPDDTRYFSLKSFRTVRVIVVDGDPTAQIYSSETFYLNLGLNPLKETYSKIESHIVTYDEFSKEELINYDVVMLCNVEGADPVKIRELKRFVKEGGGLIFFLGDKVDPKKYNETFTDLLPQKLRDVYTQVKKGNERPFEYVSIKDYSHPIIAPFKGADSGDLSTAKFYKYFVLQPSIKSESNIVLEFSNGNPCIVEKRYDKGNVLLFTSTADRDFNDLCIYPTYLPLLQQMTLYVANALGRESYSELVIGDTYSFDLKKEITDVTVTAPNDELFYEKTKTLKEVARVKFNDTFLPGFYNVYEGKIKSESIKAETPVFTFAVNVNPDESDFTKVSDKLLKTLFSDNYNYIEKSGDVSDIQLRLLRGEEIWSKILLLLVMFLLLESIISTSWRKRKKIKSAKWKEEGYRI